MGRALIHSIQDTLGSDHFNAEIKDSWVEVYGALSYDMIRAQKMA
jgi:hemoglobin-like flavoprotein